MPVWQSSLQGAARNHSRSPAKRGFNLVTDALAKMINMAQQINNQRACV